MCPCAFPGRTPAACLCHSGGGEGEGSPGRTRGGGGGGVSGAPVTAARLKAIGDELQARTAARRGRRASAGTGLATSLALLAALAWLSRRGRL